MATKTLFIGSKMPNFSLKGIDEELFDEKKLKNYKGGVIAFTCNHCPYVRAYEERMINLVDEYSDRGVFFAAINSNDAIKYPEDSFEEMKKRGSEMNFNFPYLHDQDQTVAKLFGATHTPEIFLFDEKNELRYHGKIDDNWKEPTQVKQRYLKDAIDEVINGEEVSVPETFSIGCTIKWKD